MQGAIQLNFQHIDSFVQFSARDNTVQREICEWWKFSHIPNARSIFENKNCENLNGTGSCSKRSSTVAQLRQGLVGPRPYQLVQVPYQLEPYRLTFSLTGATQQPVLQCCTYVASFKQPPGTLGFSLSTEYADMCLKSRLPKYMSHSQTWKRDLIIWASLYLCPTNCQLLATSLQFEVLTMSLYSYFAEGGVTFLIPMNRYRHQLALPR